MNKMDKEIENAAAQYAALWAATWTEESILARAYIAGARYALKLTKTTDNIDRNGKN